MRSWFWFFVVWVKKGSNPRYFDSAWFHPRIMRAAIVLAITAASLPAVATSPPVILRGFLGSSTGLATSTAYEFSDFRPPRNAESVVLYFRSTRTGTLRIDRVVTGYTTPTITQRVIPDIAIPNPPAADEVVINIGAPPLGDYRVTFTNGAVGTANISLEGTWTAGSATGPAQ